MTTRRVKDDAVTTTAEAVRKARTQLEEAEAQAASAQARAADLEAHAGAQVADNPASVDQLATDLAQARTRIELASSAVSTLQGRVVDAESAYLNAEADLIVRTSLATARAALEAHEARTRELLNVLEEHEGRFVPEHKYIEDRRSLARAGNISVGPVTYEVEYPKSYLLQEAVAGLEDHEQLLRALADGQDPGGSAEQYPECVRRPDSVVKAPAFVREYSARTTSIERLESDRIPSLRSRREALTAAAVEAEMAEYETKGVRLLAVDAATGELNAVEVALAASEKDLVAQKAALVDLVGA